MELKVFSDLSGFLCQSEKVIGRGALEEESRSEEVLATMMGAYGKHHTRQTNRKDARVRWR